MAFYFEISINGADLTSCESAGWAVLSLTRRNLAADVLSLRRRHSSATALAHGDRVVLWADGRRIFTGQVYAPGASLAAPADLDQVQVLGPWQIFNETTFVRGFPRLAGSGATFAASVSGGHVTAVNVTAGGSGYLEGQLVFGGGGGAGAVGRVNISDAGVVVSVDVLSGGVGYTSAPTVGIMPITWMPYKLGDTVTVGPGAGVEVWDPVAEEWYVPTSPTPFKFARADNAAASPPEIDLARYCCTRGLICDPNWDSAQIYRTLQEEVLAVMRYTRLLRARLAAVDRPDLTPFFTYDQDGIIAGLGTTASPKYRTWQDQKVGQLLTSLLAVKPDVAAWWDYSQEVPELLMRVASLETEDELHAGKLPLMSVDATPRPELVPAGVVIRWELAPVVPDWTWRGARYTLHCDKSPSTVLPHEPGVLTHTLDVVPDVAAFKPVLAASMMESLGTQRATGSLLLGGLTLDEVMAVRPGRCYRLPGDALLRSSQLLVQETAWEPAANVVKCSLGYPRALDLGTISDLKGWVTVMMHGWLSSRQELVPPPP